MSGSGQGRLWVVSQCLTRSCPVSLPSQSGAGCRSPPPSRCLAAPYRAVAAAGKAAARRSVSTLLRLVSLRGAEPRCQTTPGVRVMRNRRYTAGKLLNAQCKAHWRRASTGTIPSRGRWCCCCWAAASGTWPTAPTSAATSIALWHARSGHYAGSDMACGRHDHSAPAPKRQAALPGGRRQRAAVLDHSRCVSAGRPGPDYISSSTSLHTRRNPGVPSTLPGRHRWETRAWRRASCCGRS